MTDKELLYAPIEDQHFYLECVKGLPFINGLSMDGYDSNRQPMPYGVGPHSLKAFRKIVETVDPKYILEIGTNCGYSAALWMSLCACDVVSIDISTRKETAVAVDKLIEKFGSRFHFILSDSAKVYELLNDYSAFDMIFIDGGHEEHNVTADIQLAIDLGIKWLAFDDILPQFGPGVQPSIAKFKQLQQVELIGNIALYKI